jgi:hypothetical protein
MILPRLEQRMSEMIGCCGLNCHGCAIYLATREKNDEKRHKMRVEIAQQIKEHYGEEYKPEDITDCDGCRAEGGRLFSGSKNCQVRKCARPKGIENCAHCDEYACGKLEQLFATDPDAKSRLDEMRGGL